jgi:phosphoribosylcarboxyaminoimidazole (NCAIR) mutase
MYKAQKSRLGVIIAAAGMAAALPGVVSAFKQNGYRI